MGSESQDEFEKKLYNAKNELFDSQKSANPSWRSWKSDDFRLIGRWFEPC